MNRPLDPALRRRVVIEHVTPEIDSGQFPVKRTPGEEVVVEADVYADGHDVVVARLLWRRCGDAAWTDTPMEPLGNDRWTARFTVRDVAPCEYTITGWVDSFETWRQELSKKTGVGQDVGSELLEGAAIVRGAMGRAQAPDLIAMQTAAESLEDESQPQGARATAGLGEDLRAAMARHADRSHATQYQRLLLVHVDRERARFGAWYEMFPRSAGTDPSRSATFAEAAARLPYIASLGFDVLYLPPIHPIGRSYRKGRNNSLEPRAGDPGSPWAIGAAEGGHTAVEPGLGTIEDFDRFRAEAERAGLEIALDIAFQASPDHPYVSAHPEWFRHRPDGTIKYAENPPKKYQDIYPFDFDSSAWQALWEELRGVFEFWIGHGVRIFRVDNPHTKPFRFWQWVIADLQSRHPDTIFLAEAFTRPKIMRYLAKAGFTQSYSYFTWRNTKAEITEYFTELTTTEASEYMRPNLFANTPDILHEFLQQGGRPAFQIRLVLAATLGASYGIYSGFELSEHVPLRPGSEEYLDSEKYQIRVRDFDQPGSLAELISRVNAIRHDERALQFDRGLQFHDTDNPQLICYSKRAPDGGAPLLIVITLDPRHMQHGWIRVPLGDWHLAPEQPFDVVDLLSDERYRWRGEWNYVRFDPEYRVAHILAFPGFESLQPAPSAAPSARS
ncbi:MAG TPA: alpha-1,4-glucan--maltose-1-phosphate maltosyltransferase [Vicinamibacterales bacterium]|nr:alpha-1,4-glucan--maltose-1-phosphate maltosyltransferase [Vicinamibacterales bacterium]